MISQNHKGPLICSSKRRIRRPIGHSMDPLPRFMQKRYRSTVSDRLDYLR